MASEFETHFPGGREVRAGAQISVTIGGIVYVATVHRDDDTGSPEENDDGFWPSRDRTAPGWIGDSPAKSFETQQEECEAVMARYRAGKMVYCGVVVTARKAHRTLTGAYDFALWGVDVNWPGSDNSYLLQVANELLSEARPAAEKALQEAIASAEKGLAALKA